MYVKIELTKSDLYTALIKYINETLCIDVADAYLRVEVKSKQNHHAEWEEAEYRAVITQSK